MPAAHKHTCCSLTHTCAPVCACFPRHLQVERRRGASALLMALMSRSKPNQLALSKYDTKAMRIWGEFMVSCGDYLTQVSLCVETGADRCNS